MVRFEPTSPTPSTSPASGATWAASGALISGGTSDPTGVYGDYYNQEQYFTISYTRVPYYTTPGIAGGTGGTEPIQLSGVANTEHYVLGTMLNASINATYRQYKTSMPSGTPGYLQHQKLEFNPMSTDSNGFSYGSLSGTGISPFVMGAAGTITTSQKFYQRRAWNDLTDEESFDSAEGWTMAYQRNKNIAGESGACDPAYQHHWKFESQDNPLSKGSFNGAYDVTPIPAPTPSYWLGGGYHVGQDTTNSSLNYIVGLVDLLTPGASGQPKYYSQIPPVQPNNSLGDPVLTIGISGLDSTRIDWS
jgi:hypothetical protein